MACPLCFTAAVMETDHMQSPFSPPGPTNMQDGNRTQIFHQGPFTSLPEHGCGPIRVLWGGGSSVQEDALRFPLTPPGRDGCVKVCFLTEPLSTASFPQ